VKHFEDEDVAGVGGPAVTPEGDSILQKASGLVYSSMIGGGGYTYRYTSGTLREVDDYPTCNFLVRRDIFERVGGFDTHYWPGEDTKLCLDITKKLGKKIIYEPNALVYHHRRELFTPHLHQVWSYALHRGFFAKKFPETSRRLSYFLPTLFVLGLLVGPVMSTILPILWLIYLPITSVYFIAVALTALTAGSLKLSFLVFAGIVLTHITYGAGFIKGLLSTDLKR
jgi:GT2 family glycosyltransferase